MSSFDFNNDNCLLEDLEIKLLLTAIYEYYGYDFREYARPYMKRRIMMALEKEALSSISQLQDRVLRDSAAMERVLNFFLISVTSMFRHTSLYSKLRDKVIPTLKTYPHVRIWIAGCATGEEAYSVAITLMEEGLYEKTTIYATDIDTEALERAKQAIYPVSVMQKNIQNYIKSGGKRDFSEYYTAQYDSIILKSELRKNIVFAFHNIVTDGVINEFNFVLCQNVMIYFNQDLQNKTHKLLYESLCPFGILALGEKESLRFSSCEDYYQTVDEKARLYKRRF